MEWNVVYLILYGIENKEIYWSLLLLLLLQPLLRLLLLFVCVLFYSTSRCCLLFMKEEWACVLAFGLSQKQTKTLFSFDNSFALTLCFYGFPLSLLVSFSFQCLHFDFVALNAIVHAYICIKFIAQNILPWPLLRYLLSGRLKLENISIL